MAEVRADLPAERQLLGALLTTEQAFAKAADADLEAADFYAPRHGQIFDAIATLAGRGVFADQVAVADELKRRDALDAVGGPDQLAELAATVSAPGNAGSHAAIVRRHADGRERLRLARELAAADLNGDAPAKVEQLRALIAGESSSKGTLRLRRADLRRVRPVRWAWRHRLPLGNLALILGAEGLGKGVLAAWLLARATRGELPGDLEGEPARVLVIGDEDGIDSVVLPRLHAAGADIDMVDELAEDDEQLLDVRRDAGQLRALLEEGGHRLVYIDALLDALGVDVDDWRSKQIRDVLRPLRRIARDLEISVLASLHPNKGQRTSFRDLVSGSHAFNASSRSSLMLAPHPEDEDRRILVRGKGNLSVAPPGFDFRIETRELEINGHGFSLPLLTDEGDSDISIDDVVKPQRDAPVRETLADKIDALGTGEVQTRADIARALGREPDDRSVGRALDQLEDQGRWEKVGRGRWRRVGIGASRSAPMCKAADSEDLSEEPSTADADREAAEAPTSTTSPSKPDAGETPRARARGGDE